jgi:hypothetical protein
MDETHCVFNDSDLENVGTKTLVEKLGAIPAEVRKTAQSIEVVLPGICTLARKFLECMKPKYEQMLHCFSGFR